MSQNNPTSKTDFSSLLKSLLLVSFLVGVFLALIIFISLRVDVPTYPESSGHYVPLNDALNTRTAPIYLVNIFLYLASQSTVYFYLVLGIIGAGLAFLLAKPHADSVKNEQAYSIGKKISQVYLTILAWISATSAMLVLFLSVYFFADSKGTSFEALVSPVRVALPSVFINFIVFVFLTIALAFVSAYTYNSGTKSDAESEGAEDSAVELSKKASYESRIARTYPHALNTPHTRVGQSLGETLKVFAKSYLAPTITFALFTAVYFSLADGYPYQAIPIVIGMFLAYMWLVFGYSTLSIQDKKSTKVSILLALNICTMIFSTIVLIGSVSAFAIHPEILGVIIVGLTFLPFIYVYCVQLSTLWFRHSDSNAGLPPRIFFPKNYALSFLPNEVSN